MPRMDIPRRLLPLFKPKRFKIIMGGRGGAKSMSISNILLAEVQAKKIKKVACFREFQNSINDSSHALLAGQIESLGLETGANGFEIQNNQINYNGQSVFIFKGLARNPESIKSMHGQERYFIDEAQTISENSLRALTPTLREEGSEIWMSANPRSAQDPFSQRFIKPFEKELRRDKIYEDDLHTIIWVNYNNNPFFPDVLEQERLYDKKHMSSALYRHIWEGEYYDESLDSIIAVEWFDAAIDAHKKLGFEPTGAIIASHDPSDEGGDSKGYALRKGSVVLDVSENLTGDVNQGMDWALSKARADGADYFVWDCDGLGISLKRQVDQELEHSKIERIMFRGSETPDDANVPYSGKDSKTNRDTFTNKRAQYWWKLRDRFEATHRAVEKGEYIDPDLLLSLSSSIGSLDALRSEVCRIPQKRNNNGKIQIMSKIDMAKKPYQLPSPNMGDALMMSMFSPKARAAEAAKINFAGWGN
jgi:phage terminase large subunit